MDEHFVETEEENDSEESEIESVLEDDLIEVHTHHDSWVNICGFLYSPFST